MLNTPKYIVLNVFINFLIIHITFILNISEYIINIYNILNIIK